MNVTATIGELGLVLTRPAGEYRVAYPVRLYLVLGYSRAKAFKRQEAQAYYTDDPQDAVDTARIMARKVATVG